MLREYEIDDSDRVAISSARSVRRSAVSPFKEIVEPQLDVPTEEIIA